MQIDIVVFDGFDELDAIGPYEVFSHARRLGADLRVRLVTLEPVDKVTAGNGLILEPHGVLERTDVLIVAGGGWNARAAVGTLAEARDGRLPAAVARLHEGGATVASVCTGAMLLAAAGLLRGRPATTHRAALDDLAAQGAKLVDARVVDDGDVLTAGGVTSGIDLALWMVEREWGDDLADKVAAVMEYERTEKVATAGR